MNFVSIIIVTHNNQNEISRTLDAIPNKDLVLEIICIDNASFDKTNLIVQQYDSVHWIQNNRNLGFSAALNQGIRKARGDFILALNPDAILQPNSLEQMVKRLASGGEDLCGVGPKLIFEQKDYYGNTLLDSTGIVLSRENMSPYDRGHNEIDQHQYDIGDSYLGPSAACALFRKSALEKIAVNNEIFDEDFFAYFEDVDLVWRGRLLGFRFEFVPDAIVIHDRKNPNHHPAHIQSKAFTNRWFCTIKNETNFSMTFLALAFRDTLRWAWLTIKNPEFFWAGPRFIRLLPRMLRKRREIQKKRTIDHSTVRSFL